MLHLNHNPRVRHEFSANGFQQLAFDICLPQPHCMSKYGIILRFLCIYNNNDDREKKGDMTCSWPLNSPIQLRRRSADIVLFRVCLGRENKNELHTEQEMEMVRLGV